MDMFGKKRNNNRNGLMMSLVGIGIGAAAYSMMRGRNNGNMMQPIQKAMGQITNKNRSNNDNEYV
ncbi:DUF3918 family protein [Evansella cellulosilytica]|uniref:Uncharacterized protein n=1 Tax=Evansella cellulosilytica (strain ATCC 21833 / DSM 2522 / FERM P-1141 / JCM 9156 / N-4) TaxID=649639 RepID=E6U0Y2_EVAC2|nr:DUF3918 family protein [Evansella cellulosilytica]ADU30294.1 hypothetical protein Bcell_2032 [Evansella cellulosilytica DSM 2522]